LSSLGICDSIDQPWLLVGVGLSWLALALERLFRLDLLVGIGLSWLALSLEWLLLRLDLLLGLRLV
jgi:hypothetical protein